MGNWNSEMQKQDDYIKKNSVPEEYIGYDNGLILNSYHLPEEIIDEILIKLPPEDILNCRLVCKRWEETISYLVCSLYNRTYNTKHTTNTLPFKVYYITVFGKKWYKNLLKNVNGEEKFKHWQIDKNGGDRWKVEDTPQGSEALPTNVDEFNEHKSCFATSFGLDRKRQFIHVKSDKHLSFIMDTFKPSIYASEWVTGRFDCGAQYDMRVTIVGKGNNVLEKQISHEVLQWAGSEWCKKELIIENYPDNVELIVFEHSGKDTQFWKGHYGMKMAGAVVKLLLTDKFI